MNLTFTIKEGPFKVTLLIIQLIKDTPLAILDILMITKQIMTIL
jgi:hypothetical protein